MKDGEKIDVATNFTCIIDPTTFSDKNKLTIYLSYSLSVLEENSVYLSVRFLDGTIFYDQYENPIASLSTNQVPLSKKLLLDPALQAAIESAGDSTVQIIIVSLTSNAALALFLGESMGSIFEAINSV